MFRKFKVICSAVFVLIMLCSCKTAPMVNNSTEAPDNMVEEFKKKIAGETVEGYTSLYDVTELYEKEGYQYVAAHVYAQDSIIVAYVGAFDSKVIMYNISSGKEVSSVTLGNIFLSDKTDIEVTSSQTVSLYDEEANILFFPDFETSDFKIVKLDFEPESKIIADNGRCVYYTLENDCNIYKYVIDTNKNTVLRDCAEDAESIRLEHIKSNGSEIVVYMKAANYNCYARIRVADGAELENMLSQGEIYAIGDVCVIAYPGDSYVEIYNSQKPRVIEHFMLDNPGETENITLFSGNPYMLTQVPVRNGVELRFYSLSRGVLNNSIVILDEYMINSISYLEIHQTMCFEVTDSNGKDRIFIWDVEAVHNNKP